MSKSAELLASFRKSYAHYEKNPVSVFFFPANKQGEDDLRRLQINYNFWMNKESWGVEETVNGVWPPTNQLYLIVVKDEIPVETNA